MIRPSLNLVCKAAYVEEYLKELEAGKTEENYARFLDAAIYSERDSHVHQALEMIRAKIASNEGNKGDLYYQLGFGLYRIGDVEGAKRALEDCLKIDGSIWEARNLLENLELILCADEPKKTISKSALLKHVAFAGGLALGVTSGCLSNSKWLKHMALVGGVAVGAAYAEELVELAGGIKKAGELGESIEKLTVISKDSYSTGMNQNGLSSQSGQNMCGSDWVIYGSSSYGNKAGFFTAGAMVGIVGATFVIGLKKSLSG